MPDQQCAAYIAKLSLSAKQSRAPETIIRNLPSQKPRKINPHLATRHPQPKIQLEHDIGVVVHILNIVEILVF